MTPKKLDHHVSRCIVCWWYTWRCRCGEVLICACGVHGDALHYKCEGKIRASCGSTSVAS